MSDAFWDQLYRREPFRYGKHPNEFLRGQAHRIAPGGAVLCLGDGEGRNGVWLAQQGFRVTSLDQSSVALEQARASAADAGVELTTLQGVLPDCELPARAFDAAVLIFLHLPSATRRSVHRSAVRALRPGGVLVYESFGPAQLRYRSGGPPDPDRLPRVDQLRAEFEDLRIELLREVETELDEGIGHSGLASVVRLVAVAPDASVSAGTSRSRACASP